MPYKPPPQAQPVIRNTSSWPMLDFSWQSCQYGELPHIRNGINSVLADYGLPMKLTARIVRIVSFSFNYCSQKINEHI